MNKSCHTWMRHVTHEWAMPHMHTLFTKHSPLFTSVYIQNKCRILARIVVHTSHRKPCFLKWAHFCISRNELISRKLFSTKFCGMSCFLLCTCLTEKKKSVFAFHVSEMSVECKNTFFCETHIYVAFNVCDTIRGMQYVDCKNTYVFFYTLYRIRFTCVAWIIHMCSGTHSYVWHDSFIRMTWLIHTCDIVFAIDVLHSTYSIRNEKNVFLHSTYQIS